MYQITNATILHFDLLHFSMLVRVATCTRCTIRLVKLTLCLPVVALDRRRGRSWLLRTLHLLLTLLLLHGHQHILVQI